MLNQRMRLLCRIFAACKCVQGCCIGVARLCLCSADTCRVQRALLRSNAGSTCWSLRPHVLQMGLTDATRRKDPLLRCCEENCVAVYFKKGWRPHR